MRAVHRESHRSDRVGWLRAGVLGANDGLISTGSLIVGVASSGATPGAILVSGVAGLVAGALSMAAGEYVSVSSQADTERADLARERRELQESPAAERAELTSIYVARGLDADLAGRVAEQLMKHDALGAHARDELGLSESTRARPIQAALASAVAFAVGAAPPLALAALASASWLVWGVSVSSIGLLIALGAAAAVLGGASVWRGALRVAFWGAVAMGSTALVGRLVGATV